MFLFLLGEILNALVVFFHIFVSNCFYFGLAVNKFKILLNTLLDVEIIAKAFARKNVTVACIVLVGCQTKLNTISQNDESVQN